MAVTNSIAMVIHKVCKFPLLLLTVLCEKCFHDILISVMSSA